MSVIARRVAAGPVRTATATWGRISELLAPAASDARRRLGAIVDVAAVVIMEEYTTEAPLIVSPARGNQIRIYTLTGADALGNDVTESPLATWPLSEPGWAISLPCGPEDLPNLGARLDGHEEFSLRDVAVDTSPDETDRGTRGTTGAHGPDTGTARAIRVDFGEVRRP